MLQLKKKFILQSFCTAIPNTIVPPRLMLPPTANVRNYYQLCLPFVATELQVYAFYVQGYNFVSFNQRNTMTKATLRITCTGDQPWCVYATDTCTEQEVTWCWV